HERRAVAVAHFHRIAARFEARTHEPVAPPDEPRGSESRDAAVAEYQVRRGLEIHPAADTRIVRVYVRPGVAHLQTPGARRDGERMRVLAFRERHPYERRPPAVGRQRRLDLLTDERYVRRQWLARGRSRRKRPARKPKLHVSAPDDARRGRGGHEHRRG